MRMFSCRVVVSFVVLAAFAGAAKAQSIGIDWYGGSAAGTGTGNQTQMQPSETAGVVPQANWNSFLGEPQAGNGSLVLSDGSPSGATVTWMSNNDWDTNLDQSLSLNHKMMLGYLDTNDTSITNVTVSGLPASLTGPGYNVIIYFDGDNGTGTGEHRVGRYELNGVSMWGRDAGTRFDGIFTQAQTLTDPAPGLTGTQLDDQDAAVATVPAGNYMIFSGLNSADLTLNIQASVSQGGTNRAAINGMQIVAIPEPSTVALFVMGGLGLGLVARRRLKRA